MSALQSSHVQQLRHLRDHLQHLLPRAGRGLPDLLPLAIEVALRGSDAQVRQLMDLPAVADAAWLGAETQIEAQARDDGQAHIPIQWPEGEAPGQLLEGLLSALLVRLRQGCSVVVPSHRPGAAGQRQALRDAWLLKQVQAWQQAGVAPDASDPPPGNQQQCPLKVLLFDPYLGQGQVAGLVLYRVHSPGAHLALVPAPASAWLPCTVSFQKTLDDVSTWLRQQLPDHAVQDIALAWDLAVPAGTLWSLDGPSAGAALALGGLWLLRDLLHSGPRQQHLRRIQLAMLFDTHVTAALLPGGVLGAVGHVAAKAQALQAHALARQKPVLVHTAAEGGDDFKSVKVMVHAWRRMDDLIEGVATAEQLLTTAQDALLQALVQHDTRDQHPPPVGDAVLEAVAEKDPVQSLPQYALQRWAWWARALRGEVQNRFVPLQIVPDGTRLPADLRLAGGEYLGLDQLLQTNRHLPLPALLLRGGPGAGKSTLMQHHEQLLCRQALQQWHDGEPITQLPLYLPLSGLPAEADAVQWLQHTVNSRFPQCPELLDLLGQAHRRAGRPALVVMFDGLNELPTRPDQDRNQRAVQVLAALHAHIRPPGPLLLSARSHHLFDLDEAFHVAPVDVLPWTAPDVQAYIERRFVDATEAGLHWKKLQGAPAVLAMCCTPFNLNGQCQLWQDKVNHLATDRADLYRRLLWLALRRELHETNGQRDNPALHDDELFDAGERRKLCVSGLLSRPQLPPWPEGDGVLLPGLFQQALAQWLQQGHRQPPVPANLRGAVELPWDEPADARRPEAERSSVVHWLQGGLRANGRPDNRLRERWRDAVRALGLLDDFHREGAWGEPDAGRADTRFKWRHQSWGEYLASVNLLTATPDDLSPTELQTLLLRLQAGRGFARSAEAELAHLRQQVITRWDLSDKTFWPKLLADGITRPRSQVQAWLRQHWGWADAQFEVVPGRPFAAMATWQKFVHVGAITDGPADEDWCHANLGPWGDALGVAQGIGLTTGPWHSRPDGWQRLVVDQLWPPFQRVIWDQLGEAQARSLQDEAGSLQLPGVGDLDEVLGLALLGLDNPEPWLRCLLQHGLWPALLPVLPELARKLEPQGAWPLDGTVCQPVLQHLRRLLLLHSLDAGAAVLPRVAASGMLQCLDAPVPGLAADDPLQAHWHAQREQAFGTGVDLRLRLQAGLMLGTLGDNLRFERVQVHGAWHPGLRLRAPLWAALPAGRYGIGSSDQDSLARQNEHPAFEARLAAFDMARLPVTVGEWRCFIEDSGYDLDQPWWAEPVVGLAGRAWLAHRLQQAGSGPLGPRGWGVPQRSNALQPVAGVTAFEAQAFAAWAAPLYEPLTASASATATATASQPVLPAWRLAVPSELQWEAAMRGPLPAGPFKPRKQAVWGYQVPASGPGPLDFNHANTRWGWPSPVAVFSASFTHQGVADAHGNVWEWCSNALPDEAAAAGYAGSGQTTAAARWDPLDGASLRALRGGAYDSAAVNCRVACRNHDLPDYGNYDFGLRLVRCELPHSEPWTLDTGISHPG